MDISRRALIAHTTGLAALSAAPLVSSSRAWATPRTTSSRLPRVHFLSSSTGTDDVSGGTSERTAWRTVDFLNQRMQAGQVQPGDVVLFRCGDEFSGGVVAPYLSSTPGGPVTTFGTWGVGKRPVFSALKTVHTWTRAGASSWTVDLTRRAGGGAWHGRLTDDANVGFLLVDGEVRGVRRERAQDLSAQWEFSVTRGVLTVCSPQDPASLGLVQCALDENLFRGASAIRVEGLEFRGAGAHGYKQRGRVSDVVVSDCRFDLIGGSKMPNGSRYGNGIEVSIGASHAEFRDNEITRVYDAATTIQGEQNGELDGWDDIAFRRNTITDCTQSFEYWSKGTTGAGARNVRFSDNTCRDAGGGWGYAAWPDKAGKAAHLLFPITRLPTGISVVDNVFDSSRNVYMYVSDAAGRPPVGLASDRNTITLSYNRRIVHQDPLPIQWASTWRAKVDIEQSSTFIVGS